ncbi:PEGA domain-containing protein [Candidatus Woesebacteria bacterium]|nr:PEGA domain-containing protein [Candidatus Woesebacteria bacterium]
MRLKTFLLLLSASLLFSACSRFTKQEAGLKILTNTPASVALDGELVGDTPFQNSNLKVKKYAVKITPSGSGQVPYETSLKLHKGYEAQVEWTFGSTADSSSGFVFEYEDSSTASGAELQLTASPDNVPVSVDGKNVGFTPLLLDNLTEGSHTVSLQAPGFESESRTVMLVKGKRVLMTTKLAKEEKPLAPAPTPAATESADLTATKSAKATKTPTPKPSTTPLATATASAVPSEGVKKTTTVKPYVEILDTPTGFLRVRASASSTASEVYKLTVGSTVPYANASASGWLKITYDASLQGWISSQYAKLVE